jgi:hypothetical protein
MGAVLSRTHTKGCDMDDAKHKELTRLNNPELRMPSDSIDKLITHIQNQNNVIIARAKDLLLTLSFKPDINVNARLYLQVKQNRRIFDILSKQYEKNVLLICDLLNTKNVPQIVTDLTRTKI